MLPSASPSLADDFVGTFLKDLGFEVSNNSGANKITSEVLRITLEIIDKAEVIKSIRRGELGFTFHVDQYVNMFTRIFPPS